MTSVLGRFSCCPYVALDHLSDYGYSRKCEKTTFYIYDPDGLIPPALRFEPTFGDIDRAKSTAADRSRERRSGFPGWGPSRSEPPPWPEWRSAREQEPQQCDAADSEVSGIERKVEQSTMDAKFISSEPSHFGR